MSEVKYELAHVGINAENAAQAEEIATLFAGIFGLNVKVGNSSVFAGKAVEVMKTPYEELEMEVIRFRAVADCAEAVEDLKARGFEVDMDTAKYKPDGTLNAVYLKQEVAGFAIHIVKKA